MAMAWSEIASLKGGSNPNLLDNWYFGDPINQRGQTEYSAGTRNIVDRWLTEGAGNYTTTLADGFITVKGVGIERGKAGAVVIGQYVEASEHLAGSPVTVSFMYRLRGISKGLYLQSSNDVPLTLTTGDEWAIASMTYKSLGAIKNFRTNIVNICEAGSEEIGKSFELDVKAAKVEVCDHQTLAEQLDDGTWRLLDAPPNKALELLKCQRYQVVFGDSTNAWQIFGIGIAAVANKVNVLVPIPAQLRANPIVRVTSNSAFLLQGMGKNDTPVSIVFSRMTPACVQLTVGSSYAKVGDVYILRQGEDKTAQLIFDANL